MTIEFTQAAWKDFSFWLEMDMEKALKINTLIISIWQNPFKGLGKPEPLKHQLKGFWSRRINHEHRLVYRVSGKKGVDQKISIISCQFHYND